MKIKWFGHACFYIVSDDGIRILTDPFDRTVGYKIPKVEVDVVTISHFHYDHNYINEIEGDFKVIDKVGEYNFKGIEIKGVDTYHDEVKGQKRGKNIVFNIKVDGLYVCHLGDLGHIPDNSQVEEIGIVDILLVPVGGTYTIDASDAVKTVELLNPKVVIPMHYKTPDLKFNLAGPDWFIEKMGREKCLSLKELEVRKDNIGEYNDKLIILAYK